MRLSRIIMALTVGLAVVAAPAAAGAAQPTQPQPTSTSIPTPTGPPQPPPYPPVTPSLMVEPPTTFVGETVDIVGRNFGPNEIVDIVITRRPLPGEGEGGGAIGVPIGAPGGDPDGEWRGDQGKRPDDGGGADRFHLTARTNSRGDFRVPFTPKRPGIYTITATGRTSGRTASTELRVLPRHHKPPHKPPHHLPVTGNSLETPIKIGGGLVGAGTVLLLGTMLWRRRNRFGAGGTH